MKKCDGYLFVYLCVLLNSHILMSMEIAQPKKVLAQHTISQEQKKYALERIHTFLVSKKLTLLESTSNNNPNAFHIDSASLFKKDIEQLNITNKRGIPLVATLIAYGANAAAKLALLLGAKSVKYQCGNSKDLTFLMKAVSSKPDIQLVALLLALGEQPDDCSMCYSDLPFNYMKQLPENEGNDTLDTFLSGYYVGWEKQSEKVRQHNIEGFTQKIVKRTALHYAMINAGLLLQNKQYEFFNDHVKEKSGVVYSLSKKAYQGHKVDNDFDYDEDDAQNDECKIESQFERDYQEYVMDVINNEQYDSDIFFREADYFRPWFELNKEDAIRIAIKATMDPDYFKQMKIIQLLLNYPHNKQEIDSIVGQISFAGVMQELTTTQPSVRKTNTKANNAVLQKLVEAPLEDFPGEQRGIIAKYITSWGFEITNPSVRNQLLARYQPTASGYEQQPQNTQGSPISRNVQNQPIVSAQNEFARQAYSYEYWRQYNEFLQLANQRILSNNARPLPSVNFSVQPPIEHAWSYEYHPFLQTNIINNLLNNNANTQSQRDESQSFRVKKRKHDQGEDAQS